MVPNSYVGRCKRLSVWGQRVTKFQNPYQIVKLPAHPRLTFLMQNLYKLPKKVRQKKYHALQDEELKSKGTEHENVGLMSRKLVSGTIIFLQVASKQKGW